MSTDEAQVEHHQSGHHDALTLPHWVSRKKLAIFGATLVFSGITWSIFDTAEPPLRAPVTEIIELALPAKPIAIRITDEKTPEGSTALELDAWDAVTVKSGQTLGSIFARQGFSATLLHQILELSEDTRRLTKIRPGDVFEFKRSADGEFEQMRFPIDEGHYLLVQQAAGDLYADTLARDMSREIEESEGVITSSLFMAGKEAGLSDPMIMELANIFGWDIDFVLDIRQGDRFFLVFEKIYRDGEFLRDGKILAATFINQGERFQAIWYQNGEVADYFAPDGRNMRKEFLRAPLNFSYISSGFNPKRMHPVLKRIRPHNGIDYYAPKGTPVYAAGAGTVTRSGYSPANGNHVFIKHANNIVTKYLHFSKTAVKKGQKVRQGQTIGFVGSTGLATGPHLHYEFVLNGVHRNPRTVPLPKVVPLDGDLLTGFQQQSAPMLTQLSRLESASLYAQRR